MLTEHLPATTHPPQTPPRRPWTLWAFGVLIGLIGVINLVLAWDHLRHAGAYRDLGVSYPPELRAACALVWAGFLLAASWGLIRRRSWARRWIFFLMSNYGAFGVLWLVVYAQADYSRGRIAFQAALTAGLLAALAWMLRWRRMRTPFESRTLSEPDSREK